MKKIILLPLLSLFLLFGCNSDDNSADTLLAAKELFNVDYGTNSEQTMDVYLPEGRDADTKVVVLVHGGSWVAGSKEDMSFMVPIIQQEFPDHAIININYRLAMWGMPALPMQIEDIARALSYVQDAGYNVSNDYAFIGVSAGAHLSMLYSYKFDTAHNVKAVVDIVGPADFTDVNYTTHPLYEESAVTLTGTANPAEEQIIELNPVSNITAQSPPTLSFYGGQDPLVPSTQGPRLEAALNDAGVVNEFNFYPDGGHADWDLATMQDVFGKTIAFMHTHFE